MLATGLAARVLAMGIAPRRKIKSACACRTAAARIARTQKAALAKAQSVQGQACNLAKQTSRQAMGLARELALAQTVTATWVRLAYVMAAAAMAVLLPATARAASLETGKNNYIFFQHQACPIG